MHLRAERGDVLRCGDRAWIVLGAETFCIDNPPLPWGLRVGFQEPPDVGNVLTLERRGALAAALRRISELESDRSRLDNLLAQAYRSV